MKKKEKQKTKAIVFEEKEESNSNDNLLKENEVNFDFEDIEDYTNARDRAQETRSNRAHVQILGLTEN